MANVNCISKNNTDYMYEDTAGRNLIGSEQDTSTTAIKAYAVGDLFWLNNLLYRVTSAIASGGTITVGTNCVVTTVSAELAARVKSADIQNTYGSTDTRPISGKAVAQAIGALDKSDSAVSGQYVSAVSETDGIITVSRASLPTIPTVNNGQLTIQQNGTNKATFTANQSTNATANILTGAFIKTASVANNAVTFTGINDSGTYGYDVFFDITGSSTNKSPYAKLTSISGAGTSNMSLTYETDADSGTNNARLYQYK